MKPLIYSAVLTILTTALAPAAYADRPHHERGDHDRVEYARVLRVEPVVRHLERHAPERACRYEAVRYGPPAGRSHDVAGAMIVGGVIGGMIGHELGDGRDGAVLLGTLIGTSLAHDATHRATPAAYGSVYEERCRVVSRPRVEEHIDAYRVSYRHRGEIRTTRLPYDPGPRVRVYTGVR